MAINVPDNVLSTMKNAVDIAGIPNEANRFVMELFDLQYKNIFEIALYPADVTSAISISGAGTALLDSTVMRLHLQSITIPFKKIEYESADIVYFAKGITKPTEVTMTLLENEIGVVRNYLEKWNEEIVTLDPVFGYRFRDNQLKAKKNAVIIPQMGSSLPSTGWIKMEGLKFSNHSEITLGHSEAEPMTMDVTCSVDNVYWQTLTNLIL